VSAALFLSKKGSSFDQPARGKKSQTIHLRNTTGSKRFMARGSAAVAISIPLVAEDQIVKTIKPRRSSVNQMQHIFFDDGYDIDEIHVLGQNNLLDKMKDYVNKEYVKRTKGMGRLKLKKFWKNVRGKELNEEEEKNKLRQKFILEHLDPSQREMFETELLEVELDDEEAEGNDPKFEIIQKLSILNTGS
jgi:hypothetical protein